MSTKPDILSISLAGATVHAPDDAAVLNAALDRVRPATDSEAGWGQRCSV